MAPVSYNRRPKQRPREPILSRPVVQSYTRAIREVGNKRRALPALRMRLIGGQKRVNKDTLHRSWETRQLTPRPATGSLEVAGCPTDCATTRRPLAQASSRQMPDRLNLLCTATARSPGRIGAELRAWLEMACRHCAHRKQSPLLWKHGGAAVDCETWMLYCSLARFDIDVFLGSVRDMAL